MQVTINPHLYDTAQAYAEQRGLNLTVLIEDFLERFVHSKEKTQEDEIPDVVLSLLGAGGHVGKDDINGREAYYKYVEEKYQ